MILEMASLDFFIRKHGAMKRSLRMRWPIRFRVRQIVASLTRQFAEFNNRGMGMEHVWKECPQCGKKLSTLREICPDCGGPLKIKMTPYARSKGAGRKKYGGKR
jgi:hypothetical protein